MRHNFLSSIYTNVTLKSLGGLLGLSFCLVLSTVFALDETLGNGVTSAKYFWFYGVIGVASLVSLIVYGFKRNSVRIYFVDLLLVLVVSFVLAINYFSVGNAIDTKWILLMQLLVLFIIFRISLQEKALRFYVLLFFIFTGLVEAVWGLRQLYGFVPSNHNLFKLTGSFFNSGPYSGYLAMVAPVAFFYVLKDVQIFKRKFFIGYFSFYLRFTVSLLSIGSIALALPPTLSRAAWIATLVGCGFVLFSYYLHNKKLKDYIVRNRKALFGYLSIVIVFITVGAIGAYYMKKNSADGRVLIWKTSIGMIPKHPMGVGLGHFSGAYGVEQAAYFASEQGSAQEERVAGNPEYAFNEYLQIIIEFGIVPALALFTSFILLIYMGIKRKTLSVTGGFISLLVFASMSYPFSVLPFLVVLVFFITLILTDTPHSKENRITMKVCCLKWKSVLMLLIVSGAAISLSLFQRFPSYKAYQEWSNLTMISSSIVDPEIIDDYERIYPYLFDQTPFLFKYAKCLSAAKEHKKSNQILEQALRISCDPMLYNVIGQNYQQLGYFKAAEKHFLMASHIVPSRIYPYYLLANLYFENGKTASALFMAQKVLEKEPKVQSTAINEMRTKMREMIRKIRINR